MCSQLAFKIHRQKISLRKMGESLRKRDQEPNNLKHLTENSLLVHKASTTLSELAFLGYHLLQTKESQEIHLQRPLQLNQREIRNHQLTKWKQSILGLKITMKKPMNLLVIVAATPIFLPKIPKDILLPAPTRTQRRENSI